MNTKHQFFIGLNDKDSHVQEIDAITASNTINRVFIAHGCDGATVTMGRGIYRHNDGTIVQEETIIVTVFEFGDPVDIVGICKDLKNLLNQESIAVESTKTNSALY